MNEFENRIVVAGSGDSFAIYLDGELEIQGPDIDPREIFNLLGLEYETRFFSSRDCEDFFPNSLDDIEPEDDFLMDEF